MTGSLNGVRVLELARFQAGPRCGMILAEMGAEVIKIEKIGGEETRGQPPLYKGQSLYFSSYNRGKKSVTLDLWHETGKQVFRELASSADVVIESFRPGVMEQMGFGYDALAELHPGIILTRVSGFGQTGPYRDRPAFDPIGQAMSGLMHLAGSPFGRPIGTGASIIDRVTALHACIGTLAALRHSERTGIGQVIDVCLLDSGYTLTEPSIDYFLLTGDSVSTSGRPIRPLQVDGDEPAEPRPWPWAKQAKDGWVLITPATVALWARFFRSIGRPELATDPAYVGSRSGLDVPDPALREKVLSAWVRQNTVADITEAMATAGVPCAPVHTVAQAAADQHLQEREMAVEVEDAVAGRMFVPGTSIKFSQTPGVVGRVPGPGEHNDEVYCGLLRHSDEEISGWRATGVI